ncbi:MAG TPA: sulfatase-like hydrolase/transferase [Verrucomicrobiales bacterium]|nr:sulfatase-like hydrolase/transferase [Verrucomicrobiales bacterium]
MNKPTETPLPERTRETVSRRTFLNRSTGTLASMIAAQFSVTREAAAAELAEKKNIVLIITDQERPPMWFPPHWAEGESTADPPVPANLPNTERLKAHGLTFTHAFTAAAMCTPARNCMFTGLYTQQHRSFWTLTEDTDQALEEHQLDPSLPNLATCLKEAGYDVIYKGKWHMTKRVRNADGATFTEDDPARYGFDGWDGPDAGGDANIPSFGGADAPNTVHHDQRFIDDAVAFLSHRLANPTDKPFCLIVSLVNPHDVLSYPARYTDFEGTAIEGGYKDGYGDTDPWLAPTEPPVELPPTVHENIILKPSAQSATLAALKAGAAIALGPLPTDESKTNYVNFYGLLMKAVDAQIGEILDLLDPAGDGSGPAFQDTIVIRTSDHGEMAMCHGGLRQKAFLAYEEVIRIPLIWSNPELFPSAKSTGALVSNVDLLPTLCVLTGVSGHDFSGVDYSHIILDPEDHTSLTAAREYVLFTFDDIYSAGDRADLGENGAIPPPNRIQMVRTPNYKLVRYYDGQGNVPDEGEFYDLTPEGGDYYTNDGSDDSIVYNEGAPLELDNLHDRPAALLTMEQAQQRGHLQVLLTNAQQNEWAPRQTDAAFPPTPPKPEVRVSRWIDEEDNARAQVQVTFVSREGRNYQLQRSRDLDHWESVPNLVCADEQDPPITDPDQPVAGNNGPIALCDELVAERVFYRLIENEI